MVTSRAILLFTLILLFAIATRWVADREAPAEPEVINRNEPDLYMLGAHITQYSASGSKLHEIRASRLTHFPLTDMTALITPRVTLYSERDTSPWQVNAENGRLLPQSQLREETLELWDAVQASKSDEGGDSIRIETPSLTIFPGREFAETQQSVRIEDNSGYTTAARMQAYLATGRYLFFSSPDQRVTTVFHPSRATSDRALATAADDAPRQLNRT